MYSCANIVAPTGGPADNIPPKIMECDPPNKSKNFKGKEIKIKFDEFVALRDINKNLIISPLLKNKPDIRIKGKSINFKFNDTLKPNTTYVINFGNAIADITEGNILKNYIYVFSTGDYIDSLLIKGKVINSKDLTPQKDFYVFLHSDLSDSAVIKKIPDYITKSNLNGEFTINNVHEGKYHIFSLNDLNSNYLFDMPNEDFSFYDSLVVPAVITTVKLDTLKKDSVVKRISNRYFPDNILLKTFQEDRKKLYLSKTDRKERNRCTFIFSKPVERPAEILPFGFSPTSNWKVMSRNITNDTLTCWISDTLVSNMDSLNFYVKYYSRNSDGSLGQTIDTAKRLNYFKPTTKFPVKSKKKNNLISSVKKGSIIDLNRDIVIETSVPVSELNTGKFLLSEIKKDSSLVPVDISVRVDSLSKRKVFLSYNWKESTGYKLTIIPGAIKDIFDYKHDSLSVIFKTQALISYGNLFINMTGVSSGIILQFLNDKNDVIKEFALKADKKIEVNYVIPGNYNLKVIYDSNNDLKWTTGVYLKKLQPENVRFYKEKINVRANWDVEINWDLNK